MKGNNKIMVYIILIIIGVLILIKFRLHLTIKWKTLLKKGFRPSRSNFGLYTYTGNQGKGKTYSLVEYLYDNRYNSVFFGNLKDIKIKDLHYSYFKGFEGLIQFKNNFDSGLYSDILKDKQCVVVFDELFTELTRNSKLSTEIQDFLCQLRKRKIIFLTTAQVWSELPLYFRRLCRFQIDCNMFQFLNTGFLIKRFNDAENMKWDSDLQEHVAPTLELSFSKVRKVVSLAYDTRERITKSVDSSISTD